MSSSKKDTSKKLEATPVDDDATVTDESTATVITTPKKKTPKKKKSSDDDNPEKVPRMLFSLKSNSFQQAEEIMKIKSKSPSREEVQEYYHWIVSTKRKMKAWTRDKI